MMSGWLAYGAVVCRIFEVGRYQMAEKICRPGFTYDEELEKSLYVDHGIALHTYREICRPGFMYGDRKGISFMWHMES